MCCCFVCVFLKWCAFHPHRKSLRVFKKNYKVSVDGNKRKVLLSARLYSIFFHFFFVFRCYWCCVSGYFMFPATCRSWDFKMCFHFNRVIFYLIKNILLLMLDTAGTFPGVGCSCCFFSLCLLFWPVCVQVLNLSVLSQAAPHKAAHPARSMEE